MSVLVDELLLLAQLDAGRPLARSRWTCPGWPSTPPTTPGWPRRTTAGYSSCPQEAVLVRGDEHRLHQVLVNLMSNATRHTPKDTTVTVALAEAPRRAPSS